MAQTDGGNFCLNSREIGSCPPPLNVSSIIVRMMTQFLLRPEAQTFISISEGHFLVQENEGNEELKKNGQSLERKLKVFCGNG